MFQTHSLPDVYIVIYHIHGLIPCKVTSACDDPLQPVTFFYHVPLTRCKGTTAASVLQPESYVNTLLIDAYVTYERRT